MSDMDTQRTADIIEKMRLARIGEYAKWEIMLGKLENGLGLDGEEFAYVTSMAATYKNGNVRRRTKYYHRPIDPNDSVPSCNECGKKSAYYCVMNDVYYCHFTNIKAMLDKLHYHHGPSDVSDNSIHHSSHSNMLIFYHIHYTRELNR